VKTAGFSARPYDQRFLDEAVGQAPTPEALSSPIFGVTLGLDTALLAKGCGAVCVFVNGLLDEATLETLHTLCVRARRSRVHRSRAERRAGRWAWHGQDAPGDGHRRVGH